MPLRFQRFERIRSHLAFRLTRVGVAIFATALAVAIVTTLSIDLGPGLRGLAERERLVVLLTYYADRDAPRIAEDLNLSPGAVRVIRHRAIARLRECVTGGKRP